MSENPLNAQQSSNAGGYQSPAYNNPEPPQPGYNPNFAQPQQPVPGQQQWAPSAYSAPATGGYQMPATPKAPGVGSAFAGLFAFNFEKKFGVNLAKLLMLFAYIYGGCRVVYTIFVMAQGYGGAAFYFSQLIEMVAAITFAAIVAGIARLLGELVDAKKE
ncbi:hypothetical protein CJ184_006450 [Actinotignum urinale]|uniref:TM2 domain-containing protein n=1 Tax=Actinotignum urinale TaxID=190146 RepID=A0AAW9HSQ7_9ACTO|nr:hypothetical protein [Actinotignum urinale]MDY5154693.1 hypothetical protein [Actinotignum urinale]WIK58880.1 hypothetical protein CJ184_006450 [Actinotignum urinale]